MDNEADFPVDLPAMSNVQLMRYLVFTHHEFTRNIMDEITELIRSTRTTLPELPADFSILADLWSGYHNEMRQHLTDEERILFPWIEESTTTGKSADEIAGHYSGAIKQMLLEHQHHEGEIKQIRKIAESLSAQGSHVPVLALLAYKLRQLASDIAEHMRIETEMLFPRILNKIKP